MYQKGLSEAEFDRRYGSEEQCRAAVVKWRWPDGFVCPDCGGRRHSLVNTRALYQCTCRRQTSLTAGTIFAATKLSLRSWFRALYHLTNTALGNIKMAIVGTYRAIRDKHVPRYLAEFEYRRVRHYVPLMP